MGRIAVTPLGVYVAAGMLCLMGCASAPPSEELGEVAEAFGTSSCRTAAPDREFGGTIPVFSSPQTYRTCVRGYVVDLVDTARASAARAYWGDSAPTTQAACERTWGAAILYREEGGTWFDLSGVLETYGRWLGSGQCSTPHFDLMGFPLQAGQDYRLAVTMRPTHGSAQTRVMTISSYPVSTGGTGGVGPRPVGGGGGGGGTGSNGP